jgi:hypothetical protein
MMLSRRAHRPALLGMVRRALCHCELMSSSNPTLLPSCDDTLSSPEVKGLRHLSGAAS